MILLVQKSLKTELQLKRYVVLKLQGLDFNYKMNIGARLVFVRRIGASVQNSLRFIRELNYFSIEKILWTELTSPVNHGRADVFASIMDQRPLKLACSPQFILVDESDQQSSTWSYDEHEQGMVVLTNSSGRQRDG
jgi:hypothetical protein